MGARKPSRSNIFGHNSHLLDSGGGSIIHFCVSDFLDGCAMASGQEGPPGQHTYSLMCQPLLPFRPSLLTDPFRVPASIEGNAKQDSPLRPARALKAD